MIDWFFRWWLRRGRYRWSKIRRYLFERGYLANALPPAGFPEAVRAVLRQITWTRDGPLHLFDCISYPQTVWTRKKDDCDGFAVLAAALLRRDLPASDPVLLTVMLRPMSASHTVCAFHTAPDAICFFDNAALRCEYTHDYGDVAALITGGNRRVCWDVRDPETLELREFHTG
ncbi:MAG: hypothetical protein ABID87_06020 [Chloroflexota bacterium]